MAIHVKTNLCSTLVSPQTHPQFFPVEEEGMSLEGMQSLVGGMVEVHKLIKPLEVDGIVYSFLGMNEEGKFSCQQVNTTATQIAHNHAGFPKCNVVVGDCVLFQAAELS